MPTADTNRPVRRIPGHNVDRINVAAGRAPYSHGPMWIRAKWRAYALVESARAALAVEAA